MNKHPSNSPPIPAQCEAQSSNPVTPGVSAQVRDGDAADQYFMRYALTLANRAAEAGEVPVGCVVTRDGQMIGEGHNQPIGLCDPSAHAEMLALREATAQAGSYRIPGATLYVTLEPCAMCAGAMIHARIARLVYAAADPKTGAAGSVFTIAGTDQLNHVIACEGGLMAADSADLLKQFFKARR